MDALTLYQALGYVAAIALVIVALVVIASGVDREALLDLSPGWKFVVALGFCALPVSIAALIVAQNTATNRGRSKLAEALASLSANYRLQLDDEGVDDASGIIAGLRQIRDRRDYHSSPEEPTKELRIVDGARTTTLILARDSVRPAAFWVFWPGPSVPPRSIGGQYLGRLESESLRRLWDRRGPSGSSDSSAKRGGAVSP